MHVLLILGGQPPPAHLLRQKLEVTDLCIAADSGYRPLLEIGVYPDVLVGDFDSIGCDWEDIPVRLDHRPEQTATDFEKALRHLPDTTHTLTVLGGTGRRSDHFLTNLLIASAIKPELRVSFVDESQSIHRITSACPLDLCVQPHQTISLIPFSEATNVCTSGLHWDLHNAHMSATTQLGQSNVALKSEIRVSVASGCIYLVALDKM